MTVADEIAVYLGERCPHVFGVIGAGNCALFDSVARLGKTQIVCMHHEQAVLMAAAAYFRVAGTVTVGMVTTGAGSSNALTGALSAHLDSIPLVVIAGNEASTQPRRGRHYGVQGYDSAEAAKPFVKGARTLTNPAAWYTALHECFRHAIHGRPGPVWLTIPMDVQVMETHARAS